MLPHTFKSFMSENISLCVCFNQYSVSVHVRARAYRTCGVCVCVCVLVGCETNSRSNDPSLCHTQIHTHTNMHRHKSFTKHILYSAPHPRARKSDVDAVEETSVHLNTSHTHTHTSSPCHFLLTLIPSLTLNTRITTVHINLAYSAAVDTRHTHTLHTPSRYLYTRTVQRGIYAPYIQFP